MERLTSEPVAQTGRRILELARRWGRSGDGGVEIDLRLSQAELAALAGLSRESVVKALRVLRDSGLVHTRRCTLVVTDVTALHRLVRERS